jgi:hypothetical protein
MVSWKFHMSEILRSRLVVSLLIAISLVRIAFSYVDTAQSFDEPCHVAAGIEFLDKGTYTLDPVHPPLARIAIGLPLYMAGERYPSLPQNDPNSRNYNVVGNDILYGSGHYMRNLVLGRMGVVPFFVLGAVIAYLWTRRLMGETAAIFAVLLYTTTPTILAFSSIAYTDIVAASTQLMAMFIFSLWLETPDRTRTIWLGIALGIAFLAKLTFVLFLPASAVCMAFVWFFKRRGQPGAKLSQRTIRLVAAFALAAVVVWAGYGFSMKRLQETTGITSQTMPSFQHFPSPLRSAARTLVARNPRVPAAELLNGVATAWVLNGTASQSYLFERVKAGGWWYYYLVDLGVKLPIPLLILFAAGLFGVLKQWKNPKILLPLSALAGVLLITMHVKYQVGVRHILVAIPLIAIVAAVGCTSLLQRTSLPSAAKWVVALLLVWQVVESGASQSDFLAYFNQLAGRDPSKVLVTGCDLDCGQDLFRLARELRTRHIDKINLAIWSSADMDRSGLPPYEIPSSPGYSGWIAVSARALRRGDVLHQTLPPSYFDPLQQQRPVALVGKTIQLFYIPK